MYISFRFPLDLRINHVNEIITTLLLLLIRRLMIAHAEDVYVGSWAPYQF